MPELDSQRISARATPSAPPHGDHGPRAGEIVRPQGVPRSCARPPSHPYPEGDPGNKISPRGASAPRCPAGDETKTAPNQARRADPARSRQELLAPPRASAGEPARSRSRDDGRPDHENRRDISRHPSPRAYGQTAQISLFLAVHQSHQVVCAGELLASGRGKLGSGPTRGSIAASGPRGLRGPRCDLKN